MLRTLRARLTLVGLAVMVFALSIPSLAAACGKEGEPACPEYSKVLTPIENEFTTVVPLVLVALGLIVGVTFGVKWLLRRFGGHH